MRVILVGTRSFGLAVFNDLRGSGHDVALVASPPDDTLKTHADLVDIPWTDKLDPDEVAEFRADVIVSAHSHLYLSGPVRAAVKLGALVSHPSLLPRHRGKDAVRWTVYNRDPIAGSTVFWADRGVDTGSVAVQDWCFVDPAWDHSDLWRERLFSMGRALILTALDDLDHGRYLSTPQNERYASWEPSWGRPPLHRPDLPQISDRPYVGPVPVFR